MANKLQIKKGMEKKFDAMLKSGKLTKDKLDSFFVTPPRTRIEKKLGIRNKKK